MTMVGGAINTEIDLRGTGFEVRDQGDRATCLACAASDAHAMYHRCLPLSAEFLFYNAIQLATVGNLVEGITFDEAAAALKQNGQPAEVEWPYSPVQPDPWKPPPITKTWFGNLDHGHIDAVVAISTVVRSRQSVVLGVRLSAAFLAPSQPGFLIAAAGTGFGGHAVLVVGLGSDTGGQQYFLIRNSWGGSWADRGHAWLAADYLADKLIGFASVIS